MSIIDGLHFEWIAKMLWFLWRQKQYDTHMFYSFKSYQYANISIQTQNNINKTYAACENPEALQVSLRL